MSTWFSDTFTEASTTLLTSHVSDSGGNWVYWAGSTPAPSVYTSFGGVAASGISATQVYRTDVIETSADVRVSTLMVWHASAPSCGPCARLNSGATEGYLAAYLGTSSQWAIFRIGSSLSTTQIGSSSATTTYSSGDSPDLDFDVVTNGSQVDLTLSIGGSVVLSVSDTSGSRVTAAGYDGIWFSTDAVAQGMFYGDFSAGDYPVSGSATVSLPETGTVFQLSGGATGTADIVMSGVYTGTAPDQWRLVQDGTSTAVSGFDWTSFGSAPTGGTFSQTIASVPKQAGWLNVQVRNSGTPGTVYTGGKVGTGVLVMVDGQSWAWLFFSTTGYAGDSSLTADSLLRITGKQPTAWDVPATTTMNGAIACGNALVTALSCPVALIDGSWDSSGLTVSSGGGQWMSGGSAGNAYTSSDGALTAAGGEAAASIWIQGQADAASSVSQSTYYTALAAMIALRRATLGSTHPYVVVTYPRQTSGAASDAQVEAIRKAHVQACGDSDVYRVDAIDLALHTDDLHPTASSFTTLGQRCANAVLHALGVVSSSRGPSIASVTQVSAAVFDVNLTLRGSATDFTPTSGITGFRALVSGSPVTISSVSQQSATSIRITLSSTPGSLPTLDYLYGYAPTITGIVKDNSTLALPLEYNSGVLATSGAAVSALHGLTRSNLTSGKLVA